MVTDTSELLDKLNDPSATFDVQEVRALMDYSEQKAAKDIYLNTKLATVMQNSKQTKEIVDSCMQQLLDLWDSTPTVPTLIEVTNEQA